MAFGMQILISFAYSGLEIVRPEWFKFYNEIMDMGNYGKIGTIIMMFYAIIGAPIHEELIFRGVTLHYAKKAMPFFLANFLQALLFGVMHMNLVQGSYAFFAGLLLGFVYYKTNSLRVCILFHLFFNLLGSFSIFNELGNNLVQYIFIAALGALVTVAGATLFSSKQIEKS